MHHCEQTGVPPDEAGEAAHPTPRTHPRTHISGHVVEIWCCSTRISQQHTRNAAGCVHTEDCRRCSRSSVSCSRRRAMRAARWASRVESFSTNCAISLSRSATTAARSVLSAGAILATTPSTRWSSTRVGTPSRSLWESLWLHVGHCRRCAVNFLMHSVQKECEHGSVRALTKSSWNAPVSQHSARWCQIVPFGVEWCSAVHAVVRGYGEDARERTSDTRAMRTWTAP